MNTPVVIGLSITSVDNWVKASATPLIASVGIGVSVTTISMRVVGDGGAGATFPTTSQVFKLEGVDLSRIEFSTTSGVPVKIAIIGNTRGA